MKKIFAIYLKDEVKNRIIIQDEVPENEIDWRRYVIFWGTNGIFIDNIYYPPHKIDKIDTNPDT